jgi:dehydrogenase/reductase SDR family member 12
MIRSLLDTAADLTVVPGYTRLGYRLRSRGWDEELPRMEGRTVLVTGATAGLGLACTGELARLGASVRLLARSAERADLARSGIVEASGNEDVEVYICDLSSLASVRHAAEAIAGAERRLDVLVNNAGVLLGGDRERLWRECELLSGLSARVTAEPTTLKPEGDT